MRNNRGWLRIIEASIAILIVLSTLIVVYIRAGSSNQPDLSERAREILNEMARNSTLREAILNYNIDNELIISNSIKNYIPEANIQFDKRICKLDEACGKLEFTPGDVYVAERIISSYIGADSVSPENARKIRLFMWRTIVE
jgi:hypothetical protein